MLPSVFLKNKINLNLFRSKFYKMPGVGQNGIQQPKIKAQNILSTS